MQLHNITMNKNLNMMVIVFVIHSEAGSTMTATKENALEYPRLVRLGAGPREIVGLHPPNIKIVINENNIEISFTEFL